MRNPVFPNTAVLFAATAPGSPAADPRQAARGFPARPRLPAASQAAPSAKRAHPRLPSMRALIEAIEEAEAKW
jgi:hypothetical protein